MNSTRTTYLPRVMPDNANLPSEFVATEYFFPVRVFAAVTVTPGRGVFPLFAEPLISYAGATAGVAAESAAAVWAVSGGAGGCTRRHDPERRPSTWAMKQPRAVHLRLRLPC